jgi:transcriptional regulator with XRE-family HTH domain
VGERNTRKSPVGVRLREARLKKGISQKGLGILAGIDEFSASSRINQYERNKHVPDLSIAKRLARALGVPVTFLYTDDDEIAELILLYVKAGQPMRAQVARILRRKPR